MEWVDHFRKITGEHPHYQRRIALNELPCAADAQFEGQNDSPTGPKRDRQWRKQIHSMHLLTEMHNTGVINLVAGMGDIGDGIDFTGFGDAGDGGPAAQSLMQGPESLAVDLSGNLSISDLLIYRIRKITFDPADAVEDVEDGVEDLINANPGTELADKLEKVLSKVVSALQELEDADPHSALVKLKIAAHLLEAPVDDGRLDPSQAEPLFNQLLSAARILVEEAISDAMAGGGDPAKISQAQDLLSQGDALASAGEFESAIGAYSSALTKAESAL